MKKSPKKLLCPPRVDEGVLFYEEKYQKSSKRAFTPVSATPTNALRALVNSPVSATRENILPRQSDRRLNRKYGSDPRLTQAFACSDFCFNRHTSMSVKPCSRSRRLVCSGKCIKSYGGSHPHRRICSAFSCDMFACAVCSGFAE